MLLTGSPSADANYLKTEATRHGWTELEMVCEIVRTNPPISQVGKWRPQNWTAALE